MGNLPNKVNYVYKTGKGKNTNFIQKSTGPYYSGNLVITNPGDVKEIWRIIKRQGHGGHLRIC